MYRADVDLASKSNAYLLANTQTEATAFWIQILTFFILGLEECIKDFRKLHW